MERALSKSSLLRRIFEYIKSLRGYIALGVALYIFRLFQRSQQRVIDQQGE